MPLVVRTGVDLVYIPRIARIVARFGDRFVQRIYTPQETMICAGRIHALAARWAGKEAVAKLLGVGVAGIGSGTHAIPFRHIEIGRAQNGKPQVVLYDRARACADSLGLTSFDISLSHDGDYVVASAVAIGQEPDV